MKKVLLSAMMAGLIISSGNAGSLRLDSSEKHAVINSNVTISPEAKLKFAESVDQARKYLSVNPKATFQQFTNDCLNFKGFQTLEAEAFFRKIYDFAKLSPKALIEWDYNEVVIFSNQIKTKIAYSKSTSPINLADLVSTGPYAPVDVTAKWPWKLILEIVGAIIDMITPELHP
ncbi:hypothetical protein [Flavobacterium sp. GT3R68]|uniref:hypothetical protein n=1 Tax=Flavobacterium sp. GT3R68 TaxID=2594437 RepID=UPI000F881694|nr:hypothetical protein [Flavobacterium sp. GT3R68]RTY93967.1 hypothetical protein EKL32_13885 [Flavobacterium sp. GSN2]TRW93419.1 hypothetical protein FNW07_00500 [Flavobacterium sp. GT3R68]